MVELAGKLFAYQLEFFQHKFEVFDGLVVLVSFVLDIVFIFHEDAFDGMGLLILLRLWRVARIINGQYPSIYPSIYPFILYAYCRCLTTRVWENDLLYMQIKY